jgi:hypothetical protein
MAVVGHGLLLVGWSSRCRNSIMLLLLVLAVAVRISWVVEW